MLELECQSFEDDVDTLFGACVYNTVEESEAFWLDDAGVHIVFKVAVVTRHANAVQDKGGNELGVFRAEAILREPVGGEVKLYSSEHPDQGFAMPVLVTGKWYDEVLHVDSAQQTDF
jgi:hypothetical protein